LRGELVGTDSYGNLVGTDSYGNRYYRERGATGDY
jgi:hypothetical protein